MILEHTVGTFIEDNNPFITIFLKEFSKEGAYAVVQPKYPVTGVKQYDMISKDKVIGIRFEVPKEFARVFFREVMAMEKVITKGLGKDASVEFLYKHLSDVVKEYEDMFGRITNPIITEPKPNDPPEPLFAEEVKDLAVAYITDVMEIDVPDELIDVVSPEPEVEKKKKSKLDYLAYALGGVGIILILAFLLKIKIF